MGHIRGLCKAAVLTLLLGIRDRPLNFRHRFVSLKTLNKTLVNITDNDKGYSYNKHKLIVKN